MPAAAAGADDVTGSLFSRHSMRVPLLRGSPVLRPVRTTVIGTARGSVCEIFSTDPVQTTVLRCCSGWPPAKKYACHRNLHTLRTVLLTL